MSTPPQQQPREELPTGPEHRRALPSLRTGGLMALVALGTLFAVLNLNDVRVDWIIGSGKAPLIIVIVVSALFGIVLTYLAERRYRKAAKRRVGPRRRR
jgi:uncharacterized integral membrane protein